MSDACRPDRRHLTIRRAEHRGSLPNLSGREMRTVVQLAFLGAGCTRLSPADPLAAEFVLPTARQVTFIAEISRPPGRLGVIFSTSDVDERDMPAIDGIHESICALMPAMAAAVVGQREEVA